MTAESEFFRADFFSIFLRSAVLALALLAPASPARAESLNLLCEYEKGGSNEFLIDLDQKTMKIAASSKPADRGEVTDRYFKWTGTGTRTDGAGGVHNSRFEFSIDRLNGQINVTEDNDKFGHSYLSGKCRRATQKF